MQEDIFPAAEKILFDIENVVKKDSSLKSFEIIPVEDNENKSPVFHQEACLGLASWCVQPLYCYAYRRLLELRQNKHRREEPSTVARWLLGALLLNPDVTTFWNMRRELVRSHKLDPYDELSFARLVLYQKPKCFEAFAYRRWLLPHILDAKGKDYDPTPGESPLCAEIDLAGTCADRYANNYHAWSHRRHVMALRESREFTHPSLESEWKSSLVWCQRHVSDYSGLAYRQFLLRKCILESRAVVANELQSSGNSSIIPDVALNSQQRMEAVGAYIARSELWDSDGYHLAPIGKRNDVEDLRKLLRQGVTPETLDMIHGTGKREHLPMEEDLQACFRALSYLTEECEVNEDLIRMYNDHEALWYQRRFLAYLLLRSIASYNKYSYYKKEIIDARPGIRPSSACARGDERRSTEGDDDVPNKKGLLVRAFLKRSREVIEIARKRGKHEQDLTKRFTQFLAGLGLEI